MKLWLTATEQITISKIKISHFTFRGKTMANHGSWNTVILKKLDYPDVRTSDKFFFVLVLLISCSTLFAGCCLLCFMSLVRLLGFCTKDECKNRRPNCCLKTSLIEENCLNCKAQGKPLVSQYDLYVSKWLPWYTQTCQPLTREDMNTRKLRMKLGFS